jgi:hypothetical protein
MGLQPRDNLFQFLSNKVKDTWTRIGQGFEELSSSKNPQTQEKKWIDGSSETIATGYQTSWAINGNVYSGNVVNDMLFNMAIHEVKGDDALLNMITAWGWDPSDNNPDTVFKGYTQDVSFIPDNDGGGSAEESVAFSGTLNAKGDRTCGWVTITKSTTAPWTAVFSEEEPAAAA